MASFLEKGSFLCIPHEGEKSGVELPNGWLKPTCVRHQLGACLGGRMVNYGLFLLELIAQRKPWGTATRKLCFEANTYQPIQA